MVKGQFLTMPVIGRVACGARVAEFSSVRIIGVTRNAVGLNPTERSSTQGSAWRAGLVALDTFDLCVLAVQLEFRISIVVKGQSLATPVIGRVALGACVAELTLMGVLVARHALSVEIPENSASEDLALPRLVALDAFDLCMLAV
jgi:hypothetical protein